MEEKQNIDYEKFLIKSYNHWGLYLHMNQFHYLGRCYAWANRKEADLITQATPDEINELFHVVVTERNNLVEKFYSSFGVSNFRPNVAIFGNESPHLHAHLIPRFKDQIIYKGIEFIDPNPNGNYSPYERHKFSEEFLLGLKEELIGLI